jgi:hypothetical protein
MLSEVTRPSSGEGKPHARQTYVARTAVKYRSPDAGAKARGRESSRSQLAQVERCAGATTPHDAQIGVLGTVSDDSDIGPKVPWRAVKLFSADGEPAVVGVGEQPVAIFAVGQFARGFIVIGQFAVGVVVLAQFGVAVWGVGQFGLGVGWFTGMFAISGRGYPVRLIPGLDPPRNVPAAVAFEAIAQGGPQEEGYVRAGVTSSTRGARLEVDGRELPVKLTPKVAGALAAASERGSPHQLLAHLRRAAGHVVCDGLVEIPGQRASYGMGLQVARIALLVLLAGAWWWLLLRMPMTS